MRRSPSPSVARVALIGAAAALTLATCSDDAGRTSGDTGGAPSTDSVRLPPAASSVVDGTYRWSTMPVGGGGFVTGIVAGPGAGGRIYARTDVGGAYRWDPTEERWNQLLDASSVPDPRGGLSQSVESIAVSPSDDDRVYMSVGNDDNPAAGDAPEGEGRILVSDDAGESWRVSEQRWFMTGNQRFRMGSERLAVDPDDPDHVVYGSAREGLWQSFDGGATFTQVPLATVGAGRVDDPAADQVGVGTTAFVGDLVVAGVEGTGVFASNDGGTTWESIRSLDVGQYAAGATSVDGQLWLAINHVSTGRAILATFDPATAEWTDLDTPNGTGFLVFAVDPADSNNVALADEAVRDGHFWTSRDRGRSWSAHDIVVRSPQIPWLENTDLDEFMSSGRLLFAPNGDGLWFAEGMAVWHANDPYAADVEWHSRARGIEEIVGAGIVVPPGGSPIGVAADRQGFLFDDLGRYPETTLVDERFAGGTSLDYSGGDPSVLAWVGAEYHLYGSPYQMPRGAISRDGGQTWQEFGGLELEMFGGEVAVSSTDPDVIVWLPTHYGDPDAYLREPVGVYVSHDGGSSWQHLDTVGGTDAFHRFMWWFNRRALAADRVNGAFYLMSDEERFFVSTDGATTWEEAPHSPPCVADTACHVFGQLQAQPDRAERLWAGVGFGGLYRSDDAGRSPWQRVAGLDAVEAFGFGAPVTNDGPPAVFAYGRANGDEVSGLYRSDDDGATWQLISSFPNDALSGVTAVSGDPDVPGRVYVSFGGTGFAVGDPV